jgi:tetratricopeptide (TPR) repeat protein
VVGPLLMESTLSEVQTEVPGTQPLAQAAMEIPVAEVLGQGRAHLRVGNYREVAELVQRFASRPPAASQPPSPAAVTSTPRQKLSPQQELEVAELLCSCFLGLFDFTSALFYAREYTNALQRQGGGFDRLLAPLVGDKLYALATLGIAPLEKGLSMPRAFCVHRDAGSPPTVDMGENALELVRMTVNCATDAMFSLGLRHSAQFASMQSLLGRVECDKGRYEAALRIYGKAKAVFLQQHQLGFPFGGEMGLEVRQQNQDIVLHEYGVLVRHMGVCHERLGHWNDAHVCYAEAADYNRSVFGSSHPEYAISLAHLAHLHLSQKQGEQALALLEISLPIYRRVYGDKHERTINLEADIVMARQLVLEGRHNAQLEMGCGYRFFGCVSCLNLLIRQSKEMHAIRT